MATAVRADLSFTPEVVAYELDGVVMHHLAFPDGSHRVTYSPPSGWDYTGGGNLLVLHPSRGARGEATISKVSLPAPESFDESTMNRLAEEVLRSAPPDAKNIALVSQEKNPLKIEGKETFLVIIKYDQFGEPQLRSVMFLDRKNEQLRFQLTAPRTNFPHLQDAFRSSQFSWQNL
jgi:hypothetical protein